MSVSGPNFNTATTANDAAGQSERGVINDEDTDDSLTTVSSTDWMFLETIAWLVLIDKTCLCSNNSMEYGSLYIKLVCSSTVPL